MCFDSPKLLPFEIKCKHQFCNVMRWLSQSSTSISLILPVCFTSLRSVQSFIHITSLLSCCLFAFTSVPSVHFILFMSLLCSAVIVGGGEGWRSDRASVYPFHLRHCLWGRQICLNSVHSFPLLVQLILFSLVLLISLFLHYCVTSRTLNKFQLLHSHYSPLLLLLLLIFLLLLLLPLLSSHLYGTFMILHGSVFLLMSMFLNSLLCLSDRRVWLTLVWFTVIWKEKKR